MYPLHFYLCLVLSCGLVIGLILLAIFPLRLPLITTAPPETPRKIRPARKHLDTGDSDDENL